MMAATSPQKILLIAIADIANRFDVRRSLDDDRIIQLAELYRDGAALPPIEIIELAQAGKYAFIDGRHRAAARALLGETTVPAVIVKNSMQPLELFATALQANWGGAKPPSREDITHTVVRMIELGAKEKDLSDHLSFLPGSSLRHYMKAARALLHGRKMQQALQMVSDGVLIEEAARKVGVGADTIRDAIQGRKRKLSAAGQQNMAVSDAKTYITRSLRAANSGIAQKIQALMRLVETGEAPAALPHSVIDAWEKHLNGTLHRIRDLRERVNQINV